MAAQFAEEQDPAVRQAMIEAEVFLPYRRDLNNLSIQETRLRRQYEKDEAELKRLVAERHQTEKERRTEENRRWQLAIHHYRMARLHSLPFDPAEIGFEFSTEEIAAREQQIERKPAIDNGNYYEYKKHGKFKPINKAA